MTMGKNKQRQQQAPQTAAPLVGPNAPQRDPIEVAAEAAHEANRAYCQSIGDDSQVAWADAPEWQKESALKGVVFAIDNNFPSPEAMHESWCAEKVATGWLVGGVKDAALKIHPCLVPYADLPEAQRKKDDIFSATVKQSLIDQGVWPEAPTPEGDAQLAEHEGFPMYEEELNFCLTMAFMHTGMDVMCEWSDIPFLMANFMLQNPDAPVEAALIEIKLRKKVVLLPNFDQRRVHLALTLFRAYVLGWHAIEREDVAKTIAADEAARYAARPVQKLDLTDTPYEKVDGPFDPSDLGKGR
jgi:RyR domain